MTSILNFDKLLSFRMEVKAFGVDGDCIFLHWNDLCNMCTVCFITY